METGPGERRLPGHCPGPPRPQVYREPPRPASKVQISGLPPLILKRKNAGIFCKTFFFLFRQARDVRHLPFAEQMAVLQSLAPNLQPETVKQVLSFAHTLVTEESSNLGLPDFPVENLPPVIQMMNSAPNLSPHDVITR